MTLALGGGRSLLAIPLALSATTAPASMPMANRFGVERVVVVCTVDAAIAPASLRTSLCQRFADEVAKHSPYPVARAASAADTRFTSDFLLKVDARRRGAALELTVSNPQIGRPKGSRAKEPRVLTAPITENGGVPRLQELAAEAVEYFLTSPARPARPKI